MARDVKLNIELELDDNASAGLKKVQKQNMTFAEKLKKNWIGITAAITAAGLAIKKGIDITKLGAQAQQIENSFSRMAESVGIDAIRMKQAIMDASAQTVNFSNVASDVSKLMSAGLGMDTITKLMRQARAEAKLFGQSTEQAFTNLSSAITGGFLVTLKRTYGMNLEASKALKDYATAAGMTTEQVTGLHKTQALANAVLKAGEGHLKGVDLQTLSWFERTQKLDAALLDFKEHIGKTFNKVMDLTTESANLEYVFNRLKSAVNKLGASLAIIIKSSMFTLGGLKFMKDVFEAFVEADAASGGHAMFFENVSKAIKKLEKNFDEILPAIRKATEEFDKEPIHVPIDLPLGEKDQKELEENIKNTKQKLRGFWEELKSQWENESGQLYNIMAGAMQSAASSMENILGSFFFDFFTGALKSAGDYMRSFGRMMLQILSKVIAKLMLMMTFQQLAGMFGGGETFLGGIFSKIAGMFQTGTEYVPKTGLYQLHKGEKVTNAYETKEQQQQPANPNIVVVQAWDAQDVYRNRSMLVNIMADSMRRRNPSLRQGMGSMI